MYYSSIPLHYTLLFFTLLIINRYVHVTRYTTLNIHLIVPFFTSFYTSLHHYTPLYTVIHCYAHDTQLYQNGQTRDSLSRLQDKGDPPAFRCMTEYDCSLSILKFSIDIIVQNQFIKEANNLV